MVVGREVGWSEMMGKLDCGGIEVWLREEVRCIGARWAACDELGCEGERCSGAKSR